VARNPDGSRAGEESGAGEPGHDAGTAEPVLVLAGIPERLRPPFAWLGRRWVGRLLAGSAIELVRVQIFDRAMTLAAQVFTSIFPVLILLGALVGRDLSKQLADLVSLPETSRSVLDQALNHTGFSAFGVMGSLVVLLSSTGLARALTRAYAAVWSISRTSGGPRAAWRWLVTVLTLVAFAVGTHLVSRVTERLALPHLVAAVLLVLADSLLAVILPWLLLAAAVPVRMLVVGGLGFGLGMLAVRAAGSVYLPLALRTSADRYGTIGVAFTYISWLYVVSFCLLLTATLGRVAVQDDGLLGRLVRGADA
jgi:membrane protein